MSDIVGIDFVAPVTVEAETLARRGAIGLILADDFDQPMETAEEHGVFGAEVEQDFVVCQRVGEVVDDDRGD